MKKRFISMITAAVLAFSCVPAVSAQAEEKAQDLPFTFENTDYGVKNDKVVAKKLVVDNESGIRTGENGDGYLFVEKEGSSGSAYYLIGIEGCAAVFEGEPEQEPEMRNLFSIGRSASGLFIENTLYSVKDPETGTFGIFNSTAGTYTDCQADRVSSLENMILVEKDGKYGLADSCGKMVYEPVFDEISIHVGEGETEEEKEQNTYFYGYRGDQFAVLTEDGETSADVLYRSVTGSSDGLIGVEQYSETSGEHSWGVLDLTAGDYIKDCRYDWISEPDEGWMIGRYYVEEGDKSYARYEVISRDASWDMNERFGGYSVEIEANWGASTEVIADGRFFFTTYDRDHNKIFRGFADVTGNLVRDYTNAETEDWIYIERSYRGLILNSETGRNGSYYLENTRGERVLDNISSDDSVSEAGSYLIVSRNDGDVIFDPQSCQVVLSGALGGLSNYRDQMEGAGVVWFEENDGEGKYGIFNGNTGEFSGYLYEPDGRAYVSNRGIENEGHVIWVLQRASGGATVVTDHFKTVADNAHFVSVQMDEDGFIYIYEEYVSADSPDMTIAVYGQDGEMITGTQANYSNVSGMPEVFATHTGEYYGLIRKDGTRLLEDENEYISPASYYGMSFVDVDAGSGRGTCGVIAADGTWLVRESYNLLHFFTDSYQNVDSGVTIINNGLTKYFYGFGNLFGENMDTGELRVEETYPANGEEVSADAGSHIRITFNQPVNIFNDVAVGEVGQIRIMDASTDEPVLTYNMATGSPAGSVRYLSAGSRNTIILENAFQYLQKNKQYYVLMDDRCVREDTERGRWFEGLKKGDLYFSTRDEGIIEGNISYLAACGLTEQNAKDGAGKTVSEFVNSESFTNRQIWENQSATYRSLFDRALGNYEIGEYIPSLYNLAGMQVFADEENKKAILVFDDTAITDFGETFFKDCFERYATVRDQYPGYEITLTGTGAAGAVAAYVSGVENRKAVTFNAPIIVGLDMAFQYNTDVILNYQGVDRVPCVNYSNHLLSGIANGGYHDIRVAGNPYGNIGSLNSLFEYTDDFTLMEMVSETVPSGKISRVLMSGREAFNTLKSFADSPVDGVVELFSGGTELYLGTDQSERWATNSCQRDSVLYSGGGDDTLQGGIKTNTFHYSGGNAVFKGGVGKDVYYINGTGGTVEIKDLSSGGYNKRDEIISQLKKFDIANFIEGGKKLVTGILDVIGSSDVIAVNTGEVSYDMVTLKDGVYTIQLNDCTIRVNQQQDTAIAVLGLNGTGTTLAAAGRSLSAPVQYRLAEAEDYSLNGLVLEGTDISFDVYVNGQAVESGSQAGGSEDGTYFYTGVAEDGTGMVLNLSDAVEKVEIRDGSQIQKITTVSLSDERKSYEFCPDAGRPVTVDCGENRIRYTDDSGEVAPSAVQEEEPEAVLTGIAVTPPEIVDYEAGEALDLGGLKVELCFSDGQRQEVSDYSVSGYDSSAEGRQYVRISRGDESNFFTVTVHPEGTLIDSLQIPEQLELQAGDVVPLELTLNPDTADDTQLVYESSNADVAAVRGNYVQAVGEGTAEIHVSDIYNRVHAVCAVTVGTGEPEEPEPPAELPYRDVSAGDWYYEAVDYVYRKGLMTGLNDTTFAPGQNLARAQFAVILHRMNGNPGVEYADTFPDVPAGQWYTDAILWASQRGIVTGYGNTGMFGPSDNINREQMAVMMYRYAGFKGYDTGNRADFSRYLDAANVNDFAEEAMEWAVGNGIITGKYNETLLDPQGSASRAECATIMMRFVEKYGM